MSFKSILYFSIAWLFVLLIFVSAIWSITTLLQKPMAPEPWNILNDAQSGYEVHRNSFSNDLFPYQAHSQISFKSQNIQPISNVSDWWVHALQLQSNPEISYDISLSNHTTLNSTEFSFVLPVFYPQQVNTSLLSQVGSSIPSITDFSITNINKFVGETTITYNLTKYSQTLLISITFDDRYNGIAYLHLSHLDSQSDLILILNRTNNDNRPINTDHYIRLFIEIFITCTVLTFLFMYLSYLVKKLRKNHFFQE